MARRLTIAVVLVLACSPARLLACPVCGLGGTADNTWAYAAMTVVLSAVPLGMIGGIVLWIRRHSRG
jgi:hypothetical protein